MNPRRLVLAFFLFDFALLSSSALALPACPGDRLYLKSGEALEIEFNRRPGCDVRFVTVERGVVDRKLFYPSGKTDDRRLTTRERDIPQAWSELPQKVYLKAAAETVVSFLAQTPSIPVQENPPQEVCPGMVLMLSPGEEEVIHLGMRPGCTVVWTEYEGTVEEFITYPSGKTDRRVIRPGIGEFRYAEWPSSVRVKGVTKASLKFLAQKPELPKRITQRMQPLPQAAMPSRSVPAKPIPASDRTASDYVTAALLFALGLGFIYLVIRMAKTSSVFVSGQWSTLIENLQVSSQDFYVSVQKAIARRQVPNISESRVDWKEGGLFTAYREYLRISREKEVIDICGAPYGTGFFVSWWHGELRPSGIGPTLATIAIIIALDILSGFFFASPTRLIATVLAAILIFLLIGLLVAQSAGKNWVRYVLAIPLIGWLIDRLFLPPTYYRIDSASMFRAAINQAVQEVVDQMRDAKGLRALTELERKPILRDFFQHLR
jgi:hypothetical protein